MPQANSAEDRKTRREAIKQLRKTLVRQQEQIRRNALPVLVLIEGWGAAGKGRAISRVIRNLDPRFYSVHVLERVGEEMTRRPFLYPYFSKLPQRGELCFIDSGWMHRLMWERLRMDLSDAAYQSRLQSIRLFERQLQSDGTLLVKCFLQLDHGEQRRRLKKLAKHPDTAWRVSEYDLWQNAHYGACRRAFEGFLSETGTPEAPWHVVPAQDKDEMEYGLLIALTEALTAALRGDMARSSCVQSAFPVVPIEALGETDLALSLEKEEYRVAMAREQDALSRLHNLIYRLRIPAVLVFEGWDAAGKGGAIRRIAEALDPRGYEVFPIAGPEPSEKNRHYLWRFWKRLPKDGHIAIFDRSWYGRVLVERVERFCTEDEWKRAYREINEFEKELVNWGAVVIKFWIQIDRETQLVRFRERENDPEKRWKLTREDWRNREKWPLYEEAADEMLRRTNTAFAPWHVIAGNDKRHARVAVLETVVRVLQDKIERAFP